MISSSRPPSSTSPACVSSVLLLWILQPRYGHKFLLVNLLLCSLLGSITVLCSTALSKFIGTVMAGDHHPLLSPVPYLTIPILAITAVLQLRYLNKAMESFDSSQVVPTYYVTFTLASISGGGVVFRDFWRFHADHNAMLFVVGVVLCFSGVFIITRRPKGLATHRRSRSRSRRQPRNQPCRCPERPRPRRTRTRQAVRQS